MEEDGLCSHYQKILLQEEAKSKKQSNKASKHNSNTSLTISHQQNSMGGGRQNERISKGKSEEMKINKDKSSKLSATAVPYVPKVETRIHPTSFHASTGVFCTICSDEVSFLAVGTCNHPICSLCSLRLRFKNKNDDCAICKTKLAVVVVYDCRTRPDEVRFSDFGVSETAEDVFDGPPMSGMQIDSSNRMIFSECHDHFVSLSTFKRFACPCVETNCSYEATSHSSLIQHLNSAHNGLAMCSLCLENRPLFLHEHELMTKKDLKAHMAGQEKSEDSSYFLHNPHSNKFMTGHPKCGFCNVHKFDQLALYNHLQLQHFTCYLCDETKMFRYYQDVPCLRDHHRRHHFMCQICDEDESMSNSDACYSFRTAEEYRDHLQSYHSLSDTDGYISPVGNVHYHHGGGQGKLQDAHRTDHFDLDVGSANPFSQDNRIRNHSRSQRRQDAYNQQKFTSLPASTSSTNLEDFPTLGSTIADDYVPPIPPNMRVVGRISGTGRMTAPDESDLALQAMADAAHRQATIRNRIFNAAMVPAAASFPTLAETIGTSSLNVPSGSASQKDKAIVATNSGGSDTQYVAHPLSLVNRVKATSSLQGKTKESTVDDKRVARNVAMAEALAIASKQQNNPTSEVVGGTISNQAYRQAPNEPLSHFCLPSTVLFAPLFPPEMITWAKKTRNELCKVERRLQLFLQEPKASSITLKPMKVTDRLMMHCLGRYYGLLSYEYDPEPHRYVSLSKTVQSCAPDVLLSDSCLNAMFSPSSLNPAKPSATIYLQLADGLVQTWGRPSDRRQHSYQDPYAFNSSMVIFAEVILKLQELLLQYQQQMNFRGHPEYKDFSLVGISAAGPTALSIRFCDIPTAQMAERLLNDLQLRATENAQLVQNSTSVAMTLASPQIQIGIFPYFKVYPDFPVLQPSSPTNLATNKEGVIDDPSALSEKHVDEPVGAMIDSWSDGNETPGVQQFWQQRSAVDEDDEDYELVEVTVESSMFLTSKPMDTSSLTSAAGDDWEQVADQDEFWAEFLAEERQKTTEGSTVSTAKHRPPISNETMSRKLEDVPVVPVSVPGCIEFPEVQDTSDDFALALALEQQEESDAFLQGNHQGFPDLSMKDLLAVEVGVTLVGSTSSSERGPWKRVGKPTSIAPGDSATAAVAAQSYVPFHQRSLSANGQIVRDSFPSATAFMVPTAVALSQDPTLRLLTKNPSGLAVMASTGSSKSFEMKHKNKFTVLMDDGEED